MAMTDISEILEEMADNSGKNRRELALLCNKEYSTFRKELNPYDDTAKFGVQMLPAFMNATGSVAILHVLAECMGYRLVRMNSVPDKETVPEECLDTYRAITAYHESIQECQPIQHVHEKLTAAVDELEQDFVAYRKSCAPKAVGE